MGVAAGDFDNDGWVDLYRTGLERIVLLRNNGDGTFSRRDREERHRQPRRLGRARRRSSITTATAGSISSSATT